MIDQKKLAQMLKDIRFCMMTTISTDGKMHSRPMATLEIDATDFDGTLYFFSNKNSYKVQDIEAENAVNLTYVDAVRRRYFSVSGKARIDSNQERMQELWTPSLHAWFPKGLKDPELILISVTVEGAEVWDATPGKNVQEWPWYQGPYSEHVDFRQH